MIGDRPGVLSPGAVGTWLAVVAGIVGIGLGAAQLLAAQEATTAAVVVRLIALGAGCTWVVMGVFWSADTHAPLRTAIPCIVALLGGCAAAEAATAVAGVGAGVAVLAVAIAAGVRVAWRAFRASTERRGWGVGVIATLGVSAVVWFLVRHDWLVAATGLTGITAMAIGCMLGIVGIRLLLRGGTGIGGVARTVVDEALRMRAALVLVVLLILVIPTLPLVLDHSERLEYRVQFFLSWALGGTGLILSLMTIFLACGSVCGDIESNRIHLVLAKPLARWEYLVGKWVGLALFNLLLVGIAGAGTYTFVRVLARTFATDEADRAAIDHQVLTARALVGPRHDRPRDYEAGIDAAIARLEQDDPDGFARDAASARRRIRMEFDYAWHTVTPDMVSTFVFDGLQPARGEPVVQLQLKPRAHNVEVDLADVRFAIWLNDRPWPLRDGEHVEQTLPSLARHVLDVPTEHIDEHGVLRVTFANRNLVPPGETQPTAITFKPGDGLAILYRTGGFDENFLRCLAIVWIKLLLVAAAGVAAAAFLGFPTAILATLVIYFGALGGTFLRDSLGIYNVVGDSYLGEVGARLQAAVRLASELRLYEAGRMLFGFVTDVTLRCLPAFGDYDAVSLLTTGMRIETGAVLGCLLVIGIAYPTLLGVGGWLVFDRRDLVRPST
jgi:hypothetical protein